jgi:hypothetical protein
MIVVVDPAARGLLDQVDLPIQLPANRRTSGLSSDGGQAETGLDKVRADPWNVDHEQTNDCSMIIASFGQLSHRM